MRTTHACILVMGLTAAAVGSGPAWAQGASPAGRAPASGTPAANEMARARSNLSIMEGVLQRAVVLGADSLNRRVRAISPQDPPLLLAGEAEVRGFRLEGYGVFFDVEVPVLRQSVAWSLRALMDQSGVPLATALDQLRAAVRSVADTRMRQSLETALQRVELQVGGPDTPGAGARRGTTPPPAALDWLNDPGGAYTTEVRHALVDAMLEHSQALGLGADEWLIVAARDNERRDLLSQGDETATITLRVKGSDLAALRAGRITAEEAHSRVQVREQ